MGTQTTAAPEPDPLARDILQRAIATAADHFMECEDNFVDFAKENRKTGLPDPETSTDPLTLVWEAASMLESAKARLVRLMLLADARFHYWTDTEADDFVWDDVAVEVHMSAGKMLIQAAPSISEEGKRNFSLGMADVLLSNRSHVVVL